MSVSTLLETHTQAHTRHHIHIYTHTTIPPTDYKAVFRSDERTPEEPCFLFRLALIIPECEQLKCSSLSQSSLRLSQQCLHSLQTHLQWMYFKKRAPTKCESIVSYSRNLGKISRLLYQGSFLLMRSGNGDIEFT